MTATGPKVVVWILRSSACHSTFVSAQLFNRLQDPRSLRLITIIATCLRGRKESPVGFYFICFVIVANLSSKNLATWTCWLILTTVDNGWIEKLKRLFIIQTRLTLSQCLPQRRWNSAGGFLSYVVDEASPTAALQPTEKLLSLFISATVERVTLWDPCNSEESTTVERGWRHGASGSIIRQCWKDEK